MDAYVRPTLEPRFALRPTLNASDARDRMLLGVELRYGLEYGSSTFLPSPAHYRSSRNLDECRDNLKAQNYERCLEMKDFYSEVWRNVGCRHSALSSCF